MSEMEVPEPPAPTPEPEPEAPPEWTGPSRDEWEQTQAQLAQYAERLQPQQPQPQEQGPTPPDPWAEDYPQQLEAYVDAKLGFVQQLQQAMEQQQNYEAAMGTLGRLAASGGEFDKDTAWAVAREIAAREGPPRNDREAEQIMSRAAQQVREYEKRVGEAYHQQQLEQMQTIQGGQRRLPPGQPAAQTVSAGGYGNVSGAVERRFFGGN